MEAGLIGFAALLGMAFAGIHLGVAMFLTGFFGFAILRGLEASASLAGTLIFDASMAYGFTLLPLFLLMGNLVFRSGLSGDLYDAANAWIGHRPGGLAKATVAACGGFAAVCGSSIVTTATMAKVAMPSMRKYGYDDGLATGAIYALLALAVVMIYQAIDHFNFAQGEMAMFSTFVAWQMLAWGVPYWLVIPLTVVISFAGGVAIERLVIRPLGDAPVLSHIVVFIGLFAIINSLAGFIWDFTIKPFPSPFGEGSQFGGLISNHQIGMIAVTMTVLVMLFLFFQYTRVGLAMRAAAENPVSAKLVGIRVGWMIALGWGMAAAIGAIAGILIAPIVFLEPNMMLSILLYGFAGAVLGGLTSPTGAVFGGFMVGIIENLAGTYIPEIGGELKLPIALFLIVTVLVFKPTGLFGRTVVQRV